MNLLITSIFCEIIVLVLQNQKCTATNQFGCNFDDNTSLYNIYYNNITPMFGNVIHAVTLDNQAELDYILNAFNELISTHVTQNLYNSVDTLHRFFDSTKKPIRLKNITNNFNTFKSHVDSYYPMYDEDLGYIPKLIKVMKTFITRNRKFAGSVYFVNGYAKVTKEFVLSLSARFELLSVFQGNCIAGVLKFSLNYKTGYVMIVIDPEDGEANHAVIYENSTTSETSGLLRFEYALGNAKHLIHIEKLDDKLTLGPGASERNHFAFWVERCFCSIISMTKTEIFMPRHSIVKRNSDGNVLVSMYFDIFPIVESPYFTIEMINSEPFEMIFGAYFIQNWREALLEKMEEVEKLIDGQMTSNELYEAFKMNSIFKNKIFIAHYIQMFQEMTGSAGSASINF